MQKFSNVNESLTNEMLLEDRIKDAVLLAKGSFWGIIATEFPEVETGDLSSLDSIKFENECIEAVTKWVHMNRE